MFPPYGVSPQWSFASPPPGQRWQPTFHDESRAIWRWLRPKPVPFREVVLEQQIIEALAEEMAETERPRGKVIGRASLAESAVAFAGRTP